MPEKDGHTVELQWPTLPESKHYREAPSHYVSHLLGCAREPGRLQAQQPPAGGAGPVSARRQQLRSALRHSPQCCCSCCCESVFVCLPPNACRHEGRGSVFALLKARGPPT